MFKKTKIKNALDDVEEYIDYKVFSNQSLEQIINGYKSQIYLMDDFKEKDKLQAYSLQYTKGMLAAKNNNKEIDEKNKEINKRNFWSYFGAGAIGGSIGSITGYLLSGQQPEGIVAGGTGGATLGFFLEKIFKINKNIVINNEVFDDYSKIIGTKDYFKSLRKNYIRRLI